MKICDLKSQKWQCVFVFVLKKKQKKNEGAAAPPRPLTPTNYCLIDTATYDPAREEERGRGVEKQETLPLVLKGI
jgi:hypothetical protein